MVRGRKPMPSAVHELRGDYEKDPQRRRVNEPKPPKGIPQAPEYLDEFAKEEFELITKIMNAMGILTLADSSALVMYCETFSSWRKAAAKTLESGAWTIRHDKDGNAISSRCEWDRIRERSADACRRWLIEFGLTPSARTRLQVSDEVKDDFDAFLARYSAN
jgi:P27 family predicted phage terminase small subunit